MAVSAKPSRRILAGIDNIVRDDISDHLDDNPSLRSQLETSVAAAFRRVRRQTAAEIGLDDTTFPQCCPWAFQQMMDEDFWPQG
jgi:hypothetical protein